MNRKSKKAAEQAAAAMAWAEVGGEDHPPHG